jgi:hypothetical protein
MLLAAASQVPPAAIASQQTAMQVAAHFDVELARQQSLA